MTRTTGPGVVVWPGGQPVTLHGYLPDKTCPRCGHLRPAAAFWTRFARTVDGHPEVTAGAACLRCDPPPAPFPRDLRRLRFTDTFLTDEGTKAGWRQRTRTALFGPILNLTTLQMRRTADGVLRPQPKLDRH
jgi:hypothetical protein